MIACRRIVERHPEVGPLWWMCARLADLGRPVRAGLGARRRDRRRPDRIGRSPRRCADEAIVAHDRMARGRRCGPDATWGCRRCCVPTAVIEASAFLQRLERFEIDVRAGAGRVAGSGRGGGRSGPGRGGRRRHRSVCSLRSGHTSSPRSPARSARRCGWRPASAAGCPIAVRRRDRRASDRRARRRGISTSTTSRRAGHPRRLGRWRERRCGRCAAHPTARSPPSCCASARSDARSPQPLVGGRVAGDLLDDRLGLRRAAAPSRRSGPSARGIRPVSAT